MIFYHNDLALYLTEKSRMIIIVMKFILIHGEIALNPCRLSLETRTLCFFNFYYAMLQFPCTIYPCNYVYRFLCLLCSLCKVLWRSIQDNLLTILTFPCIYMLWTEKLATTTQDRHLIISHLCRHNTTARYAQACILMVLVPPNRVYGDYGVQYSGSYKHS